MEEGEEIAPNASAAFLAQNQQDVDLEQYSEMAYLVADHRVFGFIFQDRPENGQRRRVFHLAKTVSKFVFEQRRFILEPWTTRSAND
jgi:hypothetical protein